MSYVKAFALIASATLYTVAITPPQPRVVSNAVYKGQTWEYMVRYISYTAGAMIMIPSFLHSFLLVYPGVRSLQLTPLICPATPSHAQLAAFSPSFLAGLLILLCGASIRSVVIKDDHKLITAGPYAHVRHPSYTGIVLLTTGAYLMHFGAGGYVAACGIEGIPALAVLGWSWRISSLFGFVSLYRRCSVEDAKLKAQFGAGWVKYREEVPYALVPYVI
ncbi:hypothetical protein LXA43DRAFT_974942 [Ganoderma leucocontextum]|nr:hypothetical protein LXA43DRAFT_974942 [Ganoderma leucocontextum]